MTTPKLRTARKGFSIAIIIAGAVLVAGAIARGAFVSAIGASTLFFAGLGLYLSRVREERTVGKEPIQASETTRGK